MSDKVTKRQKAVLDCIEECIREKGYGPTVREVCQSLGLSSPSTVHVHLKALEDKGLIKRDPLKSRSIALTYPLGDAESTSNVIKPSFNKVVNVPLVGNVAAGSPILAEECIEDYLTFDTEGRTGEHFALKVRGESMRNAGILPGDLVVVHQQQSVRNGDIVVALFEDEATVKTYRNKDGHVWLMPENEDYEPIDGEGCAILGKVVAVVRRY